MIVETRCRHGFLRSVVRCPVCGGVDAATIPLEQRKGHVEDLTSQPIAGARVLGRASNTNKGNAAWQCLLDCGHVKIVQGSHLRKIQAKGGSIRCPEGCCGNAKREERA